jgi:hypothetical protein
MDGVGRIAFGGANWRYYPVLKMPKNICRV